MKVALFGKRFNEEFSSYYQQIIHELEKNNILISVYDEFYSEIKSELNFIKKPEIFKSHQDLKNIDVFFSIGGDGTILDSVTFIRDSNIPVLGINLGRLGFLSSVSKDEISKAIDCVVTNNYILDKRSLIHLKTEDDLFGELNFALNELTIQKKDHLSMIAVHVYVNDVLLNTYWSDGLVIATPTGSTAYSLSCNGPIITPESRNFILTPIATHNLTVRPIVIPDDSVIKLKVSGRSKEYLVALDSRFRSISSKIELTIYKEKFNINLVQMPGANFFHTIREKLNWGRDIRN